MPPRPPSQPARHRDGITYTTLYRTTTDPDDGDALAVESSNADTVLVTHDMHAHEIRYLFERGDDPDEEVLTLDHAIWYEKEGAVPVRYESLLLSPAVLRGLAACGFSVEV